MPTGNAEALRNAFEQTLFETPTPLIGDWADLAASTLRDCCVYVVHAVAGPDSDPVMLLGVYPDLESAKHRGETAYRRRDQWAQISVWKIGTNQPQEETHEYDGPGGKGWIAF